jgi:hypothetical protein
VCCIRGGLRGEFACLIVRGGNWVGLDWLTSWCVIGWCSLKQGEGWRRVEVMERGGDG